MIKICVAELLPALTAVTKAVQRRNTIPVLNNLLFEVADNQLRLSGTDLEQKIVTSTPVESAEAAATTVPAHMLNEIVRKLPENATIDATITDSNLVLETGQSKFTMQTLPASDFPEFGNKGDWQCQFDLLANNVEQINNHVFFAVSTEETRYYLNGIHWHTGEEENPKLISVATDGHRLALLKTDIASVENFPSIIIPRRFWQTIKGLFKGNDVIKVSLNSSMIEMRQGSITITSKLIDGTFPEYQRVIPTDSAFCYIVNRKELIASIERVITIASSRTPVVKFCFGDGKVLLQSNDPQQGKAEDETNLEQESSPDQLEIGFNGRYMAEILSACTTDKIAIHLNDGGATAGPARIGMVDQPDGVFVLMPMKL